MQKKHSIAFFLLFAAAQIFGQQELMLHQAPGYLWHKNSLNPAFFPADKRIAIGLPAYGLDQRHSGDIAIGDFIRKEGDTRYLDLSQALGKLEPENTFDLDHRFETVSLGLRLGGWAFQIGHAIRANASVTYPKSLAELLWNGNGAYVGQTLDIAPAANFAAWNELGVGVSRKIGILRVGGRVKYLAGTAALETDAAHAKATIFTDPDIYQLHVETDYAFRSAAVVNAIDTAGFAYHFDTEKIGYGKVFSQNSGAAFDLGATVNLGERVSLSVSLLDLGGKINWDKNANTFHSEGAWQYDGVTIPGADIINGADSISIDNQLDSLNDIFQFHKTATAFSTRLPTRAYLGGTVKLTKRWTVGAVFFRQRGDAHDLQAFGASVRFEPFKWLALGTMYAVNDRDKSNLGLHLGLKIGPVQTYFVSDNVLSLARTTASPALNFRVGGALVF